MMMVNFISITITTFPTKLSSCEDLLLRLLPSVYLPVLYIWRWLHHNHERRSLEVVHV